MTNSPTEPDMNYIQNKLDEIKNKYIYFTGEVKIDMKTQEPMILLSEKQLLYTLTDYHNHILKILANRLEILTQSDEFNAGYIDAMTSVEVLSNNATPEA